MESPPKIKLREKSENNILLLSFSTFASILFSALLSVYSSNLLMKSKLKVNIIFTESENFCGNNRIIGTTFSAQPFTKTMKAKCVIINANSNKMNSN